MQIKKTFFTASTQDIFEDTMTYQLSQERENGLKELDALVPNFASSDPIEYAEFSGVEVNKFVEQSNNAMALMYDCLSEFMDTATDEDYHAMGIHNSLLINAIKLSWDADTSLRAKGVPESLFNGLYGNFDFTIDHNGNVWFYEYNGNTPVLTYESIVLQDMFAQDKDVEQYNLLHERWVEFFTFIKNRIGSLSIMFNGFSEMVNDTLTLETMTNSANEAGHKAIIGDMRYDIDFDHMTNTFHSVQEESPLDYMMNLYPWEEYDDEALILFNKNYENLIQNGKGTIISEPAYKAVISNKAFLAYVTAKYPERARECGIIPTYTSDNFSVDKIVTSKYVKKPIYGRMSANIEVFNTHDSKLISSTEGAYSDDECVFQPFTPLVGGGKDNYQLRMWMAPTDDGSGTYVFSACGLAVRKSCSENNMEVETEIFIPHSIA